MASLAVNNPNLKISLECPIGGEIMDDPVTCSDGHTYDRKNIYNEADYRIKCNSLKSNEVVSKILGIYEKSSN